MFSYVCLFSQKEKGNEVKRICREEKVQRREEKRRADRIREEKRREDKIIKARKNETKRRR